MICVNVYVALLISSTSIARTVESRITFPTELFESYEVQDMNNSDRLTSNSNCVVKFDVNLKTLIDCLQLFGSNMNMENNSTYGGIVLAGVHTAVYNNVKGKGFLRPNDDSGDKLNMMSVLMNANAYIFDIDACKVSIIVVVLEICL